MGVCQVEKTAAIGRCAWCGKENVHLRCTRCQAVVFCDLICQKAHWVVHKDECGQAGVTGRRRISLRGDAIPLLEDFAQWLRGWLLVATSAQHGLPPCQSKDDCTPLVVMGPAAPVRRRLECAGRAFLEAYERSAASSSGDVPATSSGRGRKSRRQVPLRAASSTRPGSQPPRSSSLAQRRSRASKPLSACLQGVELFSLLGLKAGGFAASPSEEELKDAYRRLVREHHPDKHSGESAWHSQEVFLQIQEAYEFLIEKSNRETYESTLPFDDTIPCEELVRSADFFVVLGPVFQRNGKWSSKQPVPELGDASTPIEEVHDFYAFWYNFESWRDVSPEWLRNNNLQLYNLCNITRDIRRSQQKDNAKTRQKFEVQEGLRILRLVDLAWKLDPRLADQHRTTGRRKGRGQIEEQKRTSEQELQGRASETEDRELERELREEAQRLIRQEAREVAKVHRKRVQRSLAQLGLCLDATALQQICTELPEEELRAFSAEVEAVADSSTSSAVEEHGGLHNFARAAFKRILEEVGLPAEDAEAAAAGLEPEEVLRRQLDPGVEVEVRGRCRRREASSKGRRRRQEEGDAPDDAAGGVAPAPPEVTPELVAAPRVRVWRSAARRRELMEEASLQDVPEQRKHAEAAYVERELELFLQETADSSVKERLAWFGDFLRIGGAEPALAIAQEALQGAPDLVELIPVLQEERGGDLEGLADDLLLVLGECALPLFHLGVRPGESST